MEKLTHSRISTRQKCPQKEVYTYVERLRSLEPKWPLIVGAAFHLGMETLNRGGDLEAAIEASREPFAWESGDEEVMAAKETYAVQVNVLIRQAATRFTPVNTEMVEKEFDLPILNPDTGHKSRSFRLGGKIDAMMEDDEGLWIVEYKTTGATLEQYRQTYGLSHQITLYQHAAAAQLLGRPIAGTLMRTIVKSRIKRKDGESAGSYFGRLMAAYEAEPDKYIAEDRVCRNADDIERFQRELWMETKERLWQEKSGTVRRNTTACNEWGGCEFRSICLNVPGWEGMYRVSDRQHEELSSEAV